VRIEFLGLVDKLVRPVGAEQIGLLDEIEELVRRPFRIGKAAVLRIGRDEVRLFAGGATPPRTDRDRRSRVGIAIRPRGSDRTASADLAEVLTMSFISSERPACTWPSSRGFM
jgi:hypothetical protein